MNSVGAVIVASGYGGHGKKQNPMEEIDDLNVAAQIVVTFLVILEMMKAGKISIEQEQPFDDIVITSQM